MGKLVEHESTMFISQTAVARLPWSALPPSERAATGI
jgi:hypothetical protein